MHSYQVIDPGGIAGGEFFLPHFVRLFVLYGKADAGAKLAVDMIHGFHQQGMFGVAVGKQGLLVFGIFFEIHQHHPGTLVPDSFFIYGLQALKGKFNDFYARGSR